MHTRTHTHTHTHTYTQMHTCTNTQTAQDRPERETKKVKRHDFGRVMRSREPPQRSGRAHNLVEVEAEKEGKD
jgi:hypothetical protein